MLLWNIEGITNMMSLLPQDTLQDYDLVILTETMLTKEWSKEMFYCVHNFATKGATGRPRGGITCLLKPIFSPFKVDYKSDTTLLVKTTHCSILAAYFQPYLTEVDIIDELNLVISKLPKTEPLILAGGFNCRVDSPISKAIKVLDYLEGEGLMIINRKKTKTYIGHNGSSTIDLIFINDGLKQVSQNVLTSITARKHLPVQTMLRIKRTC